MSDCTSARAVERALVDHTVRSASHDPHRYKGRLGMSRIHEPEDVLVAEVLGRPQDVDRDLLLLFDLGDLFEDDLHEKLHAAFPGPEYRYRSEQVEIVAGFDARYSGHADGEIETPAGPVLVEIKSTTAAKIDRIRESWRLPRRTFAQVQTYLRHGGYDRGLVVYQARDTGAICVVGVKPIRPVADDLDAKAQRVLAEVDRRVARAEAA